MYNINISFFRSKEIDKNDFENQCDLSYKNTIAKNLLNNNQFDNCITCSSDFSGTIIDNQNIIEIKCSGLLGNNYCIIPDSSVIINKNDYIIVETDDSFEIAIVTEVGDIVKVKQKKYKLLNEQLPKFVRKADEEDLKKFHQNSEDELHARDVFKERIVHHNLEMKLVDVHFQFDRKRLFFFYVSDGRVDFRELAKDLASIFKTRIELRQIGVRDETKRIGGMGSCGREYCCTSFLINFKRISTQLAVEQNLYSNISKLSGPCGKLKCCLSFEDTN